MSEESADDVVYNAFDAYLNIGRHLFKNRYYKRALTYLDVAQEFENSNIPCILLRATCYLCVTKLEKALELAKKAHEMKKKSPHALLLMAEIYYQKGEFEEALVNFVRGRRVRPFMPIFEIGIAKCERALQNNCGSDCHIDLSSDVNLAEYYLHAFPPTTSKGASLKKPPKDAIILRKPDEWPRDMRDETLNQLLGKEYPDYIYIRELHEVEGRRAAFLEQTEPASLPDVFPRLIRSEESRKVAIGCAHCLNRKCDLWYKLDPSLKHERHMR